MERNLQNSAMLGELPDSSDAELVERAALGDGKARTLLVERYLWVARLNARKYAGGRNSIEDLLSVAYVGLVKGMNAVDPRRLTRLSCFASRCAENEVLMYLRRSKKNEKDVSLEQPVSVGRDGRQLPLHECIESDGGEVWKEIVEKERREQLRCVMGALEERQRHMLELRFGLNGNRAHTQGEVALRMGTTQSCVSKLEKRVLRYIRSQME